MNPADTIVAVSSAVGPAARMIVRLTGAQALDLAAATGLAIDDPGTARHRWIRFAGLSVPAWVYVFHAPRSYSGDNLVEFHLPGNPLLARMLLDNFFQQGARLAEPGEFTARAFFNGRIDLTEAEGVAATIAAGNEQELQASRQLMSGELARRLRPAMDLLVETLALIEVGIDFSEEDVTFLSDVETRDRLSRIDEIIRQLQEQSRWLERLSHEPTIVLTGRPNVGKSTLLNALAGQKRAVVSAIAGTTRDALSVELPLARGLVRVVDVAGLETAVSGTPVEREIALQMQTSARRAIEQADRVVWVQDTLLLDESPAVLNRKCDLIIVTKADTRSIRTDPSSDEFRIEVSALTGDGLPELRQRLDRLAFGEASTGATLALNGRHLQALVDARQAIADARDNSTTGAELLSADLRGALQHLGSIVGSVSPDELLGQIFSRFCIGK